MNLDLLLTPSSKDSFPPLTDSLFLKALRCQNFKSRPPVWIMRQAGRSLPSYRKIRERYSLEEMFRTPDLITQITRLPIDELGVDAAILFADILHVALPLGFDVKFPKQGGPQVFPIVQDTKDLAPLIAHPVAETLSFVSKGIAQLKKILPCPLIGFAGGPFTLACYLSGKNAKKWLYRNPNGFHNFLERITQATILYLKMQVRAGVDALQIFESWGNTLSRSLFKTFVIPYLKRIVDAFPKTPILLFSLGSSLFLKELAALRPAGISFDFPESLPTLRSSLPRSIAIQGNFDPELLYAPPEVITKEVTTLLSLMKKEPGLIVNLGHGVLPDTPPAHVRAFVDAVKTFQR